MRKLVWYSVYQGLHRVEVHFIEVSLYSFPQRDFWYHLPPPRPPSELRVGGCSHMAMNLRGGVGTDIFWNQKIYPSRYYIPFLHSPKQITFFHKGNNLRFGPSKYWSEICMKLSTQPWLVLLCMLTGEDDEKGLFAMQVGWFSVYLLIMCNTLYLKPLVHKTTCSSDDMGKCH